MSQKDPEHIIDYINRKTLKDPKAEYWRLYTKKAVKDKVDKTIFICNECDKVWTLVAKNIDTRRVIYYPKGHIPKIGKQIKNCKECK
jgi:hypothetical protein